MTARTLALEALHAWQEAQTFRERIEAYTLGLKAIAALEAEMGEPVAVYLVATGDIFSGNETYTRHEVRPPFCDAERLFTATPPAVPQWLPIESAPKDGTKYLAFDKRYGYFQESNPPCCYPGEWSFDEGLNCWSGHAHEDGRQATHWMQPGAPV